MDKAAASRLPVVQVGYEVLVELVTEEGTEQMQFDIVLDEFADFSLGFLGAHTPLARAILGQPVGAEVPYRQGDALSVRILAAAPSSRAPQTDVAERRQEVLRKAVEQSDMTSAMIFASSFTGKWGDYDPQGIAHWEGDESGTERGNRSQDDQMETDNPGG
jgi:hypothetical protein